MSADPLGPLSTARGDVLRMLLEGHTDKAAAARLRVSVRTVERRRAAALHRLGVRTLVEVAAAGCPALTPEVIAFETSAAPLGVVVTPCGSRPTRRSAGCSTAAPTS